ncbi:hypothetical protein ABZX77_37365 [Streptomyces sp. NPDC004237]|uniref:hypothetical protein n=1 Tax=Streptomyces sp. NPDC004237 TaxID=3154455 RepID=UPI0033BEEBED
MQSILDAEVEGGAPFARVVVPGAALSFFSLRGMEAMVPGSAVGGARGGVGRCGCVIRTGPW